MGDLFSSSQNQTSNQTSNQTGTSNTQGNIWNQVSPYLQQYLQQYSSGNVASTGQANPYQSEAAGNQSGVANGQTLQPGINASTNIANNGLTPDQISQYMSPYISNVVNPTIAAQNQQNQQALSNLKGSQASQGALGNNTGSQAAYLAGVQPGQEAAIGNLYNQGYNTAANTALSSGQLQIAGANQLGNLTNVGTNANTALGGLGNTLYGVGLTPYQIANQGVTGLGGLGSIAGSNTQSSGTGTSSGTSNTTSTPSLGSVLAGLAGTAISGFGGGGLSSLFGGGSSTTPGTSANGGWSTTTTPSSSSSWWPFASGGSVHGDNDDQKVEPFHEKVATSFKVLHGLKKQAQGGTVDHYDDGGAVAPYAPIETGWATTVEPAASSPSWSPQKFGSSLTAFSKSMNNGSDAFPVNAYGSPPGQAGKAASGFLDIMKDLQGLHGYDDGGAVTPYSAVSDAVGSVVPSMDTVKSYLPSYDTGVWAGDKPSAAQRFGSALAQVGNGPFAPFGKAIMDQQQMRYQDLAAQRAAQQLGMQGQELKMRQGLYPSQLSEAQSDALIKSHEADINWQLNAMRAKGATENELAIQKVRMMRDFAKTLTPGQVNATTQLQGAPVAPTFQTPDGKTWQHNPDGSATEITQ